MGVIRGSHRGHIGHKGLFWGHMVAIKGSSRGLEVDTGVISTLEMRPTLEMRSVLEMRSTLGGGGGGGNIICQVRLLLLASFFL